MNNVTKEILRAWYLAHKHAENNPTILLMSTKEISFSNLCAARMSVYFESEKLLFSLPFNKEYPHELIRHLEAKKNESTCSCGGSSIMKNKHPECIEKSREYSASLKGLMQYIENNLINRI